MSKVKFVIEVGETLLDCTNDYYIKKFQKFLEEDIEIRWDSEDFKVFVEDKQMKWYYIKYSGSWYVNIYVKSVEFCDEAEEDVINYGFNISPYQIQATKFEMSHQAFNMMYKLIKREGFDVFLEEEK